MVDDLLLAIDADQTQGEIQEFREPPILFNARGVPFVVVLSRRLSEQLAKSRQKDPSQWDISSNDLWMESLVAVAPTPYCDPR